MQRKATKNTRGPNAEEKRFQSWLKDEPCSVCNHPAPSIVHHCEGSTFKHNKVLVGHWFCIPLCLNCDNVITRGSRRSFRNAFGPQSKLWIGKVCDYQEAKMYSEHIPDEVIQAIGDWGR